MTILDKIVKATRVRVEKEKKKNPTLSNKINNRQQPFIFEKVLREKDISFICEIKKASPSKGIIVFDFPYMKIAKEYEQAGASAISVLTEPDFFHGSNKYLAKIREKVSVPLLRKDFIIDSYQIEEAYCLGADAILLICAILNKKEIKDYINKADKLGISCLVEVHNEDELKIALDSGARIIGVNNRDLKTFLVDTQNSIRLRHLVPKSITFVSESGISTAKDIELLAKNGVDAVLIGETLMKSQNKTEELNRLKGKIL